MSESPTPTDLEANPSGEPAGPADIVEAVYGHEGAVDFKELGRQGGLKSVEARRRRKDMSPEDRARDAIANDVGRLINELLDAAHGRGDFSTLDPKTRLAALVKALEYGVGRPTVVRAPTKSDVPEMPTTPEALFG